VTVDEQRRQDVTRLRSKEASRLLSHMAAVGVVGVGSLPELRVVGSAQLVGLMPGPRVAQQIVDN
jgi:hypothetical protein